jgi:hypothetical protein
LNSPETKKMDRATSALLKNVIKQLSGVVK